MDPQLAALYGTDVSDGEDTEKLAAAELAEKLAAEGEVDPAEITDEQVEALAAAALAGEEGEEEEQEASGEEDDEEAEVKEPEEGEEAKVAEAQEKLAEADYLGRVMAHAYTQELRKIAAAEGEEKTAGPRAEAFKAKAKEVGGKVGAHLKAHKKKYIGGAAGAAVAGGGALAYKKMKKKKASAETEQPSALDQLALRRAHEILAENGIEVGEEKKAAAPEEVLAERVEQRAIEMLTEAGYVQQQAEEAEE